MTTVFRLADVVRRHARRKRTEPSRALGQDGEDIAHRHLQASGMIVTARNFRTPGGVSAKVDLIAADGPFLVFVEVKTRQTDEFGAPDRAIDSVKRDKIRRAARHYLRRSGRDSSKVRFDTVAIVMGGGRAPNILHIRDAWSL